MLDHDIDGGRAELKGCEADCLDRRLWEVWSSTTDAFPERDALVSMWQASESIDCASMRDTGAPGPSTYLRWSYRQLHSKAEHLESLLRVHGCAPRMKAIAILWNSSDWAVFFWASMKLGMIFVPFDPRNISELPALVAKTDAQVLIAQDDAVTSAIEAANITSTPQLLKYQCSGPETPGWMAIEVATSRFPKLESKKNHQVHQKDEQHVDQVALMLLSSGTTGEPKLCQHTHKALMSQTCEYDPNPPDHIERWLVHTPVSHIFAINNILRAWKRGGAVVFPSKSFEVVSTLRALTKERCTIMSASPTLVKSILAHPNFSGKDYLHLDLVTIGGTLITFEDIRLCREGLGARHAIQAYGLTEGAPLISLKRTDEVLRDGYHPGVGKVLPGAAVRICRPGSQEVLSIGQTGELHVGGSSMTSGYVGEEGESEFYIDEGTRWFATGDQGMIDRDGVVHITGRYKDIIVRGGENIQPAKIEKALSEISSLQAVVTGVPDYLAGQVPVAIVKLPDGVGKSMVARKALTLGSMFSLGGIYTLEELGLDAFPVTTLGKAKRGVLSDLVTKFRAQVYKANEKPGALESLISLLTDAWEQITAIRPHKDQDIMFLADSISMLRFCDAVVRLCGRQVYLQDLINHNTIEKQAKLLESRQERTSRLIGVPYPALSGAKTPNMTAQPHGVHKSRPLPTDPISLDGSIVATGQRVLKDLGLLETAVEDAILVRESLHRFASNQRPESYCVALNFRLSSSLRAVDIHRALSRLIAHHPLLRAVLCNLDEQLLHIIPSHSSELMQRIIFEDKTETIQEAIGYTGLSPDDLAQTAPFMFRVTIVMCKEDQMNYLSLNFSHSIMDAISITPWCRNLDLLLHHPAVALAEMTPYKLFADLHQQYIESHPAKTAAKFHVNRLRGISLLKNAFWPVQRAPGWMISDDSGSWNKAERDRSRSEVWHGQWEDVKGTWQEPRISRIVNLTQLPTLVKQFGIHPANFAKAAIALLNVIQTGCCHAIFTSWESSRSWPFLPGWIEDSLPPAMSIDGPTLEWLVNMVDVVGNEKVIDFLQRIQQNHEQNEKHAHAPWSLIARDLQEEAEVVTQAPYRQGFVWDVSLWGLGVRKGYLTEFEVLEPTSRHNWADCGLFWNAFMLDPHNVYFIASWDTAQMNDVEIQECCDILAEIMRRLASPKNWDRTINEVIGEGCV